MGVLVFLYSIFAIASLVNGYTDLKDGIDFTISKLDVLLQFTTNVKPTITVVDTDIKFYYKSRNMNLVQLTTTTANEVKQKTDFNQSHSTMFIIHGWTDNVNSTINQVIPEALLQAADWNVFIVDWGFYADTDYTSARYSVDQVGDVVYAFIEKLITYAELNLNLLTITGHSLGAHVAGRAGEKLSGEVSVILGLDPAGPLFDMSNKSQVLDSGDAIFVETIHTTFYPGTLEPLGKLNFYLDGGFFQLVCISNDTSILDIGTCSHSVAYLYFAQSLINNIFITNICYDLNTFSKSECNTAYMGGITPNNMAQGNYYLHASTVSLNDIIYGLETYINIFLEEDFSTDIPWQMPTNSPQP